ncbi:MAG: insulinase family protein, partial [Gemmatimonadota bacterium]|nr:insulinase family protein [Gemmatimonadota bacterium]
MQRTYIINRLAALSLALAVVTGATVAGAQVKPPAPGPLRPYAFPKVDQFTLDNGLKVIVVEKHTLPVVEGRVIIDAGAMREPASKNGLSSLAGRLLSEGAGGLSGVEFARRMESMGAAFAAGGLFSNSFVDVVALKNVFP